MICFNFGQSSARTKRASSRGCSDSDGQIMIVAVVSAVAAATLRRERVPVFTPEVGRSNLRRAFAALVDERNVGFEIIHASIEA